MKITLPWHWTTGRCSECNAPLWKRSDWNRIICTKCNTLFILDQGTQFEPVCVGMQVRLLSSVRWRKCGYSDPLEVYLIQFASGLQKLIDETGVSVEYGLYTVNPVDNSESVSVSIVMDGRIDVKPIRK